MQAAVAERRRLDAVGDLAQIVDRELERLLRPAQRDRRGLGLRARARHGEAQLHGERREAGLHAVVEVAVDPAALRVRGGEQAAA